MNGSERSTAGIFQQGFRHHQAGQLQQAEAQYRQVLALNPNHADSWHLLGTIALQTGLMDQAIAYLGEAIKRKPMEAYCHCNLGNALYAQGRLREAEICCREALRLKPDLPEAHNNLGNVLRDTGDRAGAENCYRTALGLKPDFAEAHNNLGAIAFARDNLAEAEAHYRAALRLGESPAAHNNLGGVLDRLGRNEEAATCYKAALRINPANAVAHNNLGNAFAKLGRFTEAEACYREALRIKPDYAEAETGLGNGLVRFGRFAEAEACFRKVLQLKPDMPEVYSCLGGLLSDLGRLPEAEAHLREAVRLRPDYPEAHTNLAHALFAAGRLDEAWPEYEWRWRLPYMRRREFTQPQWNGEAAGGSAVLFYAEQGLGDTLQFCRFVPQAAASGVRIILEVQRPLLRLLATLEGVERIVAAGDALPHFDSRCPLMSLPGVLGTTLPSLATRMPYLNADAALAARWRDRLAGLEGLRVGLVWAGNPRPFQPEANVVDRRRSITLDHFAELGAVPGCCFVSLQKGEAATQTSSPPMGLVIHDWTDELDDFMDTAALIENLDLVISVDTSVVHLAGALGKPVWLLNRFDSCWRWMRDRDDSPWYPSLRQLRQPSPGDWASVVKQVKRDLESLLRARLP